MDGAEIAADFTGLNIDEIIFRTNRTEIRYPGNPRESLYLSDWTACLSWGNLAGDYLTKRRTSVYTFDPRGQSELLNRLRELQRQIRDLHSYAYQAWRRVDSTTKLWKAAIKRERALIRKAAKKRAEKAEKAAKLKQRANHKSPRA